MSSMVLLIALALLQSHEGVEIALEKPVLGHAIFLELALRMLLGDLGADAPGVLQHFPLIR